MMKRWLKVEAEQLKKHDSIQANKNNGTSVERRHFNSTCPCPINLMEDTQISNILPQYQGVVDTVGRLNSLSRECFKENTRIGTLNTFIMEIYTCFQVKYKGQCYKAEFSI